MIRRHPHVSLAALTLVLAAPYALLGVGFVLDDWFALGNAHFDGALAAAGRDQWLARPGQALVYAATFGLIGAHPLLHYAVQVALGAVAAVLLFQLLLRLVDSGPALAISALWVVIPNHGSLVRWPSAIGILMALILLLAGAILLAAAEPRLRIEVGAALLLAASVLCYEATAPAAGVAALVLPRMTTGSWRWRETLMAWAALGAAMVWMLVNFHPAKAVVDVTADVSQLFAAHFGWGVAPGPGLAAVLIVLGAIGLVVAGVQAIGVAGRPRQVDWMLVTGLAVIVLGTLPFVKYYYAPLGAGDRANVVAGIGTALCWYSLGRLAWRWRPPLAAGAVAVVLVAMGAAGLQADRAWHRAARSGERILAALPAENPGGMVVVGPRPVQIRNVAPFLDRSNIEPAVQLRLDDRSVSARMSWSEEDFDSVPPRLRIDLRGK